MTETNSLVTGPQQLRLDLQISAEREVDGILMGVLSDGTPYLNIRGLAKMCGVDHTSILDITARWQSAPLRPREAKVRELVRAQGGDDSIVFIATNMNGTIHHAIPAAVCMAILEYYAFEAKGGVNNTKAANSYRLLARRGFQDFIYAQVGYNPTGAPDIAWKQFHDRVSLSYHTVPDGYFSIFKEIADMQVTLIRAGAHLGQDFIPDISVGIHWGKHWTTNNLDVVYGARQKYDHNYPSYFPQSASNPQPAYCYPDEGLAEFRDWFRKAYINKKMPTYLLTKVRDGQISAPAATAAIEAFTPKRIAPPPVRPQRF
jgi:hypothetical protein